MPDAGLMRPTVDGPGGRGPEDVAAEDLEDRQEGGRDTLEGRVPTEEPGRQAREAEEQQDPDQSWVVRGGLPRRDGGRGRDRTAAEVKGDDDDDRGHQDGRHGGSLKEDVPVRRGHDDCNRAPYAPVRESKGLGQLADRRDGHVRATTEGALKAEDRKSTRLNSSHGYISYAVFCLKKKK